MSNTTTSTERYLSPSRIYRQCGDEPGAPKRSMLTVSRMVHPRRCAWTPPSRTLMMSFDETVITSKIKLIFKDDLLRKYQTNYVR